MDTDKIQIINADCFKWMKQQAPNTIDAVVTDPPYGLEFMGSEWDTFAVRLPKQVLDARRFAHLSTVEQMRRTDVTNKAQLTLLVYQEWTRQWALEAYRLLKPGAYMLVMSGTRTMHRMIAGLEDAGFLIRDCLCWIYATGFPKSYDISKGFDKKAGAKGQIVGFKRGVKNVDGRPDRPNPSGVGGRAVGARQITVNVPVFEPSTDLAKQWQGWGTALKPAWEPIALVQKPLEGTYCENVERWGVGGLNIDGCRVGISRPASGQDPSKFKVWKEQDGVKRGDSNIPDIDTNKGRFPANVQVDSEPEGLLDDGKEHKTGDLNKPQDAGKSTSHTYGKYGARDRYAKGDTGGFSRFFIIPKASQAERGDQNKHPTVKPIRLFKQLIKLITPPGGTALDPFLGSGTACLAAKELNMVCIGIEKSKEYCEIALARLSGYGGAHET